VKIVQKHFLHPGEPALTGASAQEVSQAAGMLEKVIAEVPDWWNAQWFYGKSQMSLGNYEAAYDAFWCAYRVEKKVEAISRELAGACVELQRFDEAVEIATAAVALDPGNAESLGNLAVSFLLAGQIVPARKTIDAAIKLEPNDRINQTISRVLREVETGSRAQPKSLRELTKPAQPKKWSLFKRFWK
jgi:Flp pilus assembly protein TadD